MFGRGLAVLTWGLLAAGMWLAAPGSANAADTDRYYHYPYYYFPHSYEPNYVKWPDPRHPYARPPAYMAYPPYLDPEFRYELWTPHRYHKGFHFWLDQF